MTKGGKNPKIVQVYGLQKVSQCRFGFHFSFFIPNVLPILSKTQILIVGCPAAKGNGREGEDKTKTNTQIPRRFQQLETESNGVYNGQTLKVVLYTNVADEK